MLWTITRSYFAVVVGNKVFGTVALSFAGRIAFNNIATAAPMQYPVDKKMETPLRIPLNVESQSVHFQKFAVYKLAF